LIELLVKFQLPNTFVPLNMIAAQVELLYKIISAGAEINFERGDFVVSSSETAIQPWILHLLRLSIDSLVTQTVLVLCFFWLWGRVLSGVNGRMLENGALIRYLLLKLMAVCNGCC
jgi:hypothetical protein